MKILAANKRLFTPQKNIIMVSNKELMFSVSRVGEISGNLAIILYPKKMNF
jgi:hypothetical protein